MPIWRKLEKDKYHGKYCEYITPNDSFVLEYCLASWTLPPPPTNQPTNQQLSQKREVLVSVWRVCFYNLGEGKEWSRGGAANGWLLLFGCAKDAQLLLLFSFREVNEEKITKNVTTFFNTGSIVGENGWGLIFGHLCGQLHRFGRESTRRCSKALIAYTRHRCTVSK